MFHTSINNMRKTEKLSPIFKKRLKFFQKLGELNEGKQKGVLSRAPKNITRNLVKLIKLTKNQKLPPKHLKRLKPFKKSINAIIKNAAMGTKCVIKSLRGGLIGALIPLLVSAAGPAISAIVEALS